MATKTGPAAPKIENPLNRPAKSYDELKALLTRPSVLEQIKLTLPQHMKPERMTKILLSAVLKTPALMRVNQLSLMQSLAQLSEVGLEPGSAWGHVYLIPFENKKEGRTDVNIIIGYRGLIELARRSGFVEQIEAQAVFEGEKFELKYGLSATRHFEHIPDLTIERTDPSRAIAVYCIARLKGGGEHLEVMSMSEVRRIMHGTQSKGAYGPWKDHFLEMARKTVVRRAAKYLPLSPEIRDALELEDASEDGVGTDAMGAVVQTSVRKPTGPMAVVPEITDAQWTQEATPVAEESAPPQDPPGTNPVTGEVAEETPDIEPEAGTIDHLLWRIRHADGATLQALVMEAAGISKEEPRRLEVGAAISARRKEVTK